MTFARADEPLPDGRLSVAHYRAIHHHLFQDVYDWAGLFRTVRMTKRTSTFCYSENINGEMRRIFVWLRERRCLRGLSVVDFASTATKLRSRPSFSGSQRRGSNSAAARGYGVRNTDVRTALLGSASTSRFSKTAILRRHHAPRDRPGHSPATADTHAEAEGRIAPVIPDGAMRALREQRPRKTLGRDLRRFELASRGPGQPRLRLGFRDDGWSLAVLTPAPPGSTGSRGSGRGRHAPARRRGGRPETAPGSGRWRCGPRAAQR